MPPGHQDTKLHKDLNINKKILVDPLCLGVFVAKKALRSRLKLLPKERAKIGIPPFFGKLPSPFS